MKGRFSGGTAASFKATMAAAAQDPGVIGVLLILSVLIPNAVQFVRTTWNRRLAAAAEVK